MYHPLHFALAIFTLVSLAPVTLAVGEQLRTVALSNRPAPGVTDMATLDTFVSPAIAASGRTAFLARLRVGGVVNSRNDSAIFSEGSGLLTLLAREGSQAPGLEVGSNFGSLIDSPALNPTGQAAFDAPLSGGPVTSENDSSIWSELNGTLQLLVREGSPAPGTQAANFGPVGSVKLVDGHAAFRAFLRGQSSGDAGIWSTDNGVVNLVALEGGQAPGTPTGAVFSDFDRITPRLGGSGDTGFSVNLRVGSGGVTANNQAGVWSERNGVLGLVARQGSQAPDVPAGGNFGSSIGLGAINSASQVAFSASLQSGGNDVTSGNNAGVWSEGRGPLGLVARKGDQAPGTPAGAVFETFFGGPSIRISDEGETAFFASLLNGVAGVTFNNDFGVWSEDGGSLRLVARKGSQAPGTPPGTNFNLDSNNSLLPPMAMNSSGRLAFLGSLQVGDDVSFLNDVGIWAQDRDGILTLIVREGDVLQVAPGDFRTVRELSFRSSQGGDQGQGFNDIGQIAFSATFTNGTSGVFVSNLAGVPEPASLALSVFTVILGAASVRRWY